MAAIRVQIGARLCVSASHDTSSRGLDLDEKCGFKRQENAAGPPSVNNNSFVCHQPDYMKSHQALPQTQFVSSFPSNSICERFFYKKNGKQIDFRHVPSRDHHFFGRGIFGERKLTNITC